MSEVPTDVAYRFTCSSLRVSGTKETRQEWDATEPVESAAATVELTLEADRRTLVPLPAFDHGHDFEIKLAPDGRLAAVSNTTRGLLGDIVEAAVGVVSFATGLIGAIAGPGLSAVKAATPGLRGIARPKGVGEPPPMTPAQEWEKENPNGDFTRLAATRAGLEALNDAVVRISVEAATTDAPAPLFRRLMAVRVAIAQLEEQISAINARRDAWHATHHVSSEEHEFALATDQVFVVKVPGGVVPRELSGDELPADGPAIAMQVLATLGVAVVEIRDTGREDRRDMDDGLEQRVLDREPDADDLDPGIWFRAPRSAQIALYVRDAASGELVLHGSDRYWVLDRWSRLNSFPLEAGQDFTVSAVFSPDGILQSLALDEQSKLQAVLDAFKGAPKQAAEGLKAAKSVADTWDALRASRSARELKELESRKKQLEAELANRGLEADAASAETLKEIKDRLARLRTERAIGKIETPEPEEEPDPTAERDAKRLALARRLGTEVRIERAQEVLAGFKENGDAG